MRTATTDELDRRAWSSAVLIGVAFAAAAMIYSFWGADLIFHKRGWYAPGDIWMVVNGGRFVWDGALGYVYQGTQSYSLPFSFIVMAPISGLIDHYRLIEGSPYPVPFPNAWLLVGPYSLMFGIFLLHAVRKLAFDLGQRRKLWATQLLAVVVVLVPGFQWGHFEDVLALTFCLYAARKLLAADYVKAGLYLSLAVFSKQWAVMLIPFLLFLAPAGRRLRSLVAACALPGAFVLFVLGADWSDASKALFSPVNLGAGAPGHMAFYATWFGSKTSQWSRTAGVLISPLVAWRMRKAKGAPQILAAFAVLLLMRPFSEAINYSYYWAPPLLLAGLVGLAAHGRLRIRDWVWPVLAMVWTLPHGNPATAIGWYAGEAILLCLTTAEVVSNLGVEISLYEWFRKGRNEPMFSDMAMPIGPGEKSWKQ